MKRTCCLNKVQVIFNIVVETMAFLIVVLTMITFSYVNFCDAHGMMIEPLGRQSRWRRNATAPTNYNDNALFCGGFSAQWVRNKGKCGLCGDDYKLSTPRPHEFGGFYGEGVIVGTYKTANIIPIAIIITANHFGDFTWDLCNMDNDKESENCFKKNRLKLLDGSEKYKLKSSKEGIYKIILQIPDDLKCRHCVLRWTYRAANSWGWCEDGTGALGCGPQEHFRSCADIAII